MRRPGMSGLPSGAHSRLVRRTVGYRLPHGSLVVDVAWRPGAALEFFADEYPTIAVMAQPRPDSSSTSPAGRPVAIRSIRADVRNLPLADASVDCVLLLDPEWGPVGPPGALAQARRVLRSGGLVVVSAGSTGGRPEGRGGRFPRGRASVVPVIEAVTDLGLVTEQVTHLQPPWRPMSLVSRVQVRARSGRSAAGADDDGMPFVCRMAATMSRLDSFRAHGERRSRGSSVLVFARRP